jgi:hypothetical protein
MRRRSDLPDALRLPHPERLGPEHPRYAQLVALHSAALEAGDAFYTDPTSGLWVMTAAKLWERPCCNNGCRHCPWFELEERLAGGPGSDRPR